MSRKSVAEAVKAAKPVEYQLLWRNKFLATHTKSFPQFLKVMEAALQTLKDMRADGVRLREDGIGDDYAWFHTEDPQVAKKYGFNVVEEEEDEED